MKEEPLIWIIDDDNISKYVMKRYLKELNILDPVDCPDSIEALEILSKNRNNQNELPDIIFLDLNMPILNGFQFLKEFKNFNNEIEKKIDIFMLTSSMNDDDLTYATSVFEISGYFIKPIKLEQLALAVENEIEELKQI
ncbi:response regulator [Maribacter sp. ACAM166]|uniref:response regulator n=1 Tax=Maribacter sp. ACAM166 TaxID=2508996 RepID=UPI0010FF0A8F|nr:response regulator [Maribacter sp. ACAM166]TLP80367.1 response regulator [Maribacter sp. ACAM166]